MVKDIWGIICECIKNVILAEMTVIHFKSMFEIEILRFFENDFLKTADTAYRHLNSDHDFEN